MKKSVFRIALSVGSAIFLLYLAIHYWPTLASWLGALFGAALPLIVGAGVAYIFSLPMNFYQRHWFPKSRKKWAEKTRVPCCLALSILSVLAVIALVVGLVLPQLISCVKLIIEFLPGAISTTLSTLEEFQLLPKNILSVLESVDWKSRIKEIVSLFSSGITGVVDVLIATVTEVVSGVITSFLSFIFAIYLLLSKERLSRQIMRVSRAYLPHWLLEKSVYVLGVLDSSFRKYFVGQCLEAVILGVLCAIGMLILQLPYAAMIGALIAFTALIPIAGAYIGAAVGAFMILTVSPIKALIFLIFLVILQQVEGNFIYPKVVGSSIGLPGIWVLAAVTVGGGLFGIPGMLLGVPLVSACYRILKHDVKKREMESAAEAAPAEDPAEPEQSSEPQAPSEKA